MGELTLNKIAGALLAIFLTILGLQSLSNGFFGPPAVHHGDHDEHKSLNEQIAERYHYYVEVAEASDGGEPPVEDVFDLGLALASADVSRGAETFGSQCSTCHTVEQGGANGTGPALWGIVGAPKAGHDGFSYSPPLSEIGGEWTYEELNAWLHRPSRFARGTSMAFAGLNRDSQRADVIAYLASQTANAPAFPDPLPAATDATETSAPDEAHSVEGEVETPADTGESAPAPTIDSVATDITDEIDDVVEDVTETVEEAVQPEQPAPDHE